jgi:hypothetical protein
MICNVERIHPLLFRAIVGIVGLSNQLLHQTVGIAVCR